MSNSGIHVFDLAFKHVEDILNIAFSHVCYLHTLVLFDSHVSMRLPIVDSLCFGMTSLNRLQLLQALTDYTEIRLFVCS